MGRNMANSITDVKAGIKALLETVETIEAVYAYEPLQLPKLPCATIQFLGFDPARTEVNSMTVAYQYLIRLYFDLIDAEAAATQMENLVWSVLGVLVDNPSLSSTCIYSDVVRGEAIWAEFANRQRPLEGFEIEIHAIKEED